MDSNELQWVTQCTADMIVNLIKQMKVIDKDEIYGYIDEEGYYMCTPSDIVLYIRKQLEAL